MEANKLYETLLGLSNLGVTKVEISKSKLDIWSESNLSSNHCSHCLKQCSSVNQSTERTIQDLTISGRKVYLHLKSRQFICEECNRYFHERYHFVSKHERMTIRFENYIYKRCIGADLTYVSIQEGLHWNVVNRLFKKWVKKDLAECHLLDGVRALGIDEIALKKGHKDFVCVLVNLETGEVFQL